MDKTELENLAGLFKALSHPTRVQIVMGLIEKEECNVSKMVEKLGIAQPTISQHINILKSYNIIQGYRKGNQICYKIINNQVKKLFESIT